MATSFSTLTAMTSTPRVIQASTTSFCLAGSRSVGPSQSSSTPISWAASSAPLRQLMKYGSPLALGIMATTGRCAGSAAWPWPRRRGQARSSCRRERTDQPVPADHQERRGQDDGAQGDHLRVLHFFLPRCGLGWRRLSGLPRQAVEEDRGHEQCTREDAGELGGRPAEPQAVLQDDDGEKAEDGAEHGAATPEDGGAAQHDRGDGHELVARPRVRLRLAEVGHVDDRGQAGEETGQRVEQAPPALHRACRRSARPRPRSRSRRGCVRGRCGAASSRWPTAAPTRRTSWAGRHAADVALAEEEERRRRSPSSSRCRG